MQDILKTIREEKSIAMLAPSFVIDFPYPAVIGMLKKLGFDKVTEVTYGARMANEAYVDYVKNNPDQELYITSPCPTVAAFIKAKHPEFYKYLVPVYSPMGAMGRLLKTQYPDHKIFFISPCPAKKIMDIPRYAESIDGGITMRELATLFEQEGIDRKDFTGQYAFDSLVQNETRIYPLSGGLATTAHVSDIFNEEEILITEGPVNISKAFEEIANGSKKYRFLDLLNCDGGCISGPALTGRDLPLAQRREIVDSYRTQKTGHEHEGHDVSGDISKGISQTITL